MKSAVIFFTCSVVQSMFVVIGAAFVTAVITGNAPHRWHSVVVFFSLLAVYALAEIVKSRYVVPKRDNRPANNEFKLLNEVMEKKEEIRRLKAMLVMKKRGEL